MTWGRMKKKLESEYLCSILRGRIQYFVTSYSKCPDHEGRAAIRLDGKEVLKSSYYEYWIKEYVAAQKVDTQYSELSISERRKKIHNMILEDGGFDQTCFYAAFKEFDNQSIERSIISENPIVRLMAILDKRVGKRRLVGLKDEILMQPKWIQFFYNLRVEAEGIKCFI